MKIFSEFVQEGVQPKTLYHVTFTKSVPGILRKGILPLQPSNWVAGADGKRYGGGYIFAFESKWDAIRWAARTDWSHFHKSGSGKVSIVQLKDNGDWQIDTADPLSQAGNYGNWLKRLSLVPPSAISHHEPVTAEMVRSFIEHDRTHLEGVGSF